MLDVLTGLPTHRDLVLNLSAMATVALWIDIDGLIWLNDQFGSSIGDSAIVDVANALRSVVEPTGGRLFRVAGDEFLATLASPDQPSGVTIAERIVERVDSLAIPYRRLDRPSPTHLQVNVAVLSLTPDMIGRSVEKHGLGDPIHAAAIEAIAREKLRRNVSAGVSVVV